MENLPMINLKAIVLKTKSQINKIIWLLKYVNPLWFWRWVAVKITWPI